MNIIDRLYKLQDIKYKELESRLVPNVDNKKIIGIRVPEIRKLAKEYILEEECNDFLKRLPHDYLDENMLHGLLISEMKDFEKCIYELERFLPYVDNWAVCDTISPRVFLKNKDKYLYKLFEWIKSSKTYTCRFGICMLMRHFLDDDFKKEYLEVVSKVKSNEYYVNMMIAWFFATALSKQWDDTIKYLENKKFDKWVHNKIIQKARESYRITKEQKEYLKGLK